MEVMQTIKEILKLNPFFKEQMQLLLERTEIHEAGKLADFGAALTTADAQSLQEVLGTLNVTSRIEKTLLLLKKELELSKLQSEISREVEGKISENQRRHARPRAPAPARARTWRAFCACPLTRSRDWP